MQHILIFDLTTYSTSYMYIKFWCYKCMYAHYPKVFIKLTFTVENDKYEYLLCQPFSAFLDTLYFCCVHEHLKFNRFNNSFLSCLPKIVINASNRCTSILNKDLYSLNKNHFSNPRSTPIICLPPATPETPYHRSRNIRGVDLLGV